MSFLKTFANLPGWRTQKKIVVFESDDWGSIRIPNLSVKKIFNNNGILLDTNYFTKYDSLENSEDLELLIKVLENFSFSHGKIPVFTTLNIMGNPNFKKIEESSFTKYYWKPVNETYLEYGYDADVLKNIWKKGIDGKYFSPSFHGREHLNVLRWMKCLNSDFPVTKMAFDYNFTGIHPQLAKELRKEYQAAFDLDRGSDIEYIKNILIEGLAAFESYFGFKSRYFVPPNSFFPKEAMINLKEHGVQFFNTPKFGLAPLGEGKYQRFFRYLGLKSREGLVYLTRNASFEPSDAGRTNDWVNKSLREIENSFKWNKPAIIGSHRVNYIGSIDPGNRERGLKELSKLITEIIKKWPDVEFLSSTELGDLILGRSDTDFK